MRPTADRAWHQCLSMYDRSFHPPTIRRILSGLLEGADPWQAWAEVAEAAQCYHECRLLMGRHAWTTMVLTSLKISVTGYAGLPPNRATPIIAGTPSPRQFREAFEPVETGDQIYDIRARILYLQQAAFCQISVPELLT